MGSRRTFGFSLLASALQKSIKALDGNESYTPDVAFFSHADRFDLVWHQLIEQSPRQSAIGASSRDSEVLRPNSSCLPRCRCIHSRIATYGQNLGRKFLVTTLEVKR